MRGRDRRTFIDLDVPFLSPPILENHVQDYSKRKINFVR